MPERCGGTTSGLIENALKYTPEGGEISVAVYQNNEQIAVEIADNGCGIAAEDLPHIFEKFYRGKPLVESSWENNQNPHDSDCGNMTQTSGVGLGLYLVQNLVKQNGGEITAESPVGTTKRGSKFTVLLPTANL